MAIQLINGEKLKIAGSDLEQKNPVIISESPAVKVLSSGKIQLICPYMVYQDLASFSTNWQKHSLKTEKFYKNSIKVVYDRSTDGDQYEFVDIKMKEDIVANYDIPAENIIFTPHAE